MTEIGFSAEQYIEEQSKYILQRINCGNSERLYLEFGGKLVQDKHAMRVLPGFDENAKIMLLQMMKDKAEIIICIYSGDIMTNKTRQDFGITYDLEVLRLMDIFRKHDLEVNSVVVTRYEDNSPAVDKFINKLERRGIREYKPVALEPMSPNERRIIHAALQNSNRVKTYSVGEEPNRKVIVAPIDEQ